MILTLLRTATAASHERAEAAMPTLAGLADLRTYRACVVTMHGFHASWEPAIWDVPGVSAAIGDDSVRRRLPLLERDLRALGVSPSAPAPAPVLAGPAEALGALYVLEGSGLGGRVIARHVQQPLALTPDHGLAFFSGHGEQTGPLWKLFGARLQSWVDRNGHAEDIVTGAIHCFDAFEAWLHARSHAAAA